MNHEMIIYRKLCWKFTRSTWNDQHLKLMSMEAVVPSKFNEYNNGNDNPLDIRNNNNYDDFQESS